MSKNQVRPTSKGQVTLPIAIRRKLNVGPDTYLDVSISGETIVLRPLKFENSDNSRIYSSEEIDEFLKTDKISLEDAEFFKKILK